MPQLEGIFAPPLPLGKGVECIMLAKGFLKNQLKNSHNFKKINNLPIQFMNQIHGTAINQAVNYSKDELPKTDGLFTNSSQFCLGLRTADCVPVALSLDDGSQIAVLHAGWRGLNLGIIENFLDNPLFKKKKINAWIGPAISKENYEVGPEVFDAFTSKQPASKINFFKSKNENKWKFDLPSEVERRLKIGNVNVFSSQECTFKMEKEFYSFRRDQSLERMITIIWRNDEK